MMMSIGVSELNSSIFVVKMKDKKVEIKSLLDMSARVAINSKEVKEFIPYLFPDIRIRDSERREFDISDYIIGRAHDLLPIELWQELKKHKDYSEVIWQSSLDEYALDFFRNRKIGTVTDAMKDYAIDSCKGWVSTTCYKESRASIIPNPTDDMIKRMISRDHDEFAVLYDKENGLLSDDVLEFAIRSNIACFELLLWRKHCITQRHCDIAFECFRSHNTLKKIPVKFWREDYLIKYFDSGLQVTLKCKQFIFSRIPRELLTSNVIDAYYSDPRFSMLSS